jgi:predicted secreted protein
MNSGEVVREIDDPHTGDQWMLMRDPFHPEGPGRLVLAGGPAMRQASAVTRDDTPPNAPRAILTPFLPVIHAGDALIVEERTAVVVARLEAVALGPAAQGAVFKARIKIGGKVVRAIAVAAGRAVFVPSDEAQP